MISDVPKPHNQGAAGPSLVPDLWSPKPATRHRVPRNGSLHPEACYCVTSPRDSDAELLGITVNWWGQFLALLSGPCTSYLPPAHRPSHSVTSLSLILQDLPHPPRNWLSWSCPEKSSSSQRTEAEEANYTAGLRHLGISLLGQ